MSPDKNIYVIDDEKDIRELFTSLLTSEGYLVQSFENAEDFLFQYDEKKQGLFLIDWTLPGMSGIDIMQKIRARDQVSPIFMVSGKDATDDVVEGLQSGADDFIKKPFQLKELLIKVENAYLKLVNYQSKDSDGELKLLEEASSFIKDGKVVSLTTREFLVFKKLYLSKDQAVSREELVAEFSGEEVTIRNIDVHIFSLRRKVKEVDVLINSVRGIGYRLTV